MLSYLIRRLLQGLVVIFGVTVVTFIIPSSFHANIAREIYGVKAPQSTIDAFNHKYYFDRNVIVQYLHYMSNLLHGDLGVSFNKDASFTPVGQVIGDALFNTLWLVLVSLVISLLIAIPLGLFQALKRNSAFDYVATGLVFVVYSTPAFVLGLVLIDIFAIRWHILPFAPQFSERTGPFSRLEDMFSYPLSYVLPLAVLVGLSVGGFSRFMRGSVLDTLVQDYIRTARAKGASSNRVLFRHAFRNAIIPIVTILGLSLPSLFGGAVITEHLFNISGMGTVTVTAVGGNDINVIMAATLLVAIATVLGNLVSDLSVAAIDPRIRLIARK